MEVPSNLDLATAAAIPEVWITAYQLCRMSNIRSNENVLIHAAASGVGTALIQLINHYKAISIGICSTEEKISDCKK